MEAGMEDRHRQEREELQGKIEAMKRAVPKGDKKRKQKATADAAIMEAELDAKHELERNQLTNGNASVEICTENMKHCSVMDEKNERASDQTVGRNAKMSKAAKRREKKEREERERNERIAQQELENKKGPRHIEQQELRLKLSERELQLFEVSSDGDCLYNSIAHQLEHDGGTKMSVEYLRHLAAAEMRANSDEYLPYITTPDGNLLDTLGFQQYCNTLESTPEWGGHIELKALSAALNKPITVIQASQSDLNIEQGKGDPLTIVYHRYLYELGEHYNSVVKQSNTGES